MALDLSNCSNMEQLALKGLMKAVVYVPMVICCRVQALTLYLDLKQNNSAASMGCPRTHRDHPGTEMYIGVHCRQTIVFKLTARGFVKRSLSDILYVRNNAFSSS